MTGQNETVTWLTRDEAARRAQVSRRTVDRWRACGMLPTYRGAKGVYVSAEDLEDILVPRYVDGERAGYPGKDGDLTVLGPEVFASPDGRVISWKGDNYVRAEEEEE